MCSTCFMLITSFTFQSSFFSPPSQSLEIFSYALIFHVMLKPNTIRHALLLSVKGLLMLVVLNLWLLITICPGAHTRCTGRQVRERSKREFKKKLNHQRIGKEGWLKQQHGTWKWHFGCFTNKNIYDRM